MHPSQYRKYGTPDYSKARFYCCGKAFSTLYRLNAHKTTKRHAMKKEEVVET